MHRTLRVISVTVAMVLVAFYALTFASPNASAVTKTWTTDTDFNDPGAIFNGVEVVGTGVPAKVELVRTSTNWLEKKPSTFPSKREGGTMVYIPTTGVTLLFGGYGAPYLGDTWEYEAASNVWTKINTPGPPGRQDAGLSYDSVKDVVVLFGGWNGSDPDVYMQDTWEYNVTLKTWAKITPPSPAPRLYTTPLAYHATASRHVTAGMNVSTSGFQTWAYNSATGSWTLRTSSGPSARTGHNLAYHANLQRTVLFGGLEPFPPPGTLKSDTWEYNYASNSWSLSPASGPSARVNVAMTYRTLDTSIILFAGGPSPLQDTWKYDQTRAWSQISTAKSPPVRQLAGLSFDIGDQVVVLFGGRGAASARLNDTWTLGAAYWAAGKYTSGVYDSGDSGVDWGKLWWNKTSQPANTFLRFQLAASNSPTGPFNFYGPAGTPTGYYTTPGTAIWSGIDGMRYLRFLGDFGTFDPDFTPSMEDVSVDFVIVPQPPKVISTDPVHMDLFVPLNKVLAIQFSEAMDKPTVNYSIESGPNHTFVKSWSADSTILYLTPTPNMPENKVFVIRITGKDPDGNSLVPGPVPNPFAFRTVAEPPFITATTPPSSGTADPVAPIVVDFNEPMNTSSFQFSITPPINITGYVWSNGDRTVSVTHTGLTQCISYTAQVTQAKDKAELPLIPGPVPNPWSFIVRCDNPYITNTDPANDQIGVGLNQNVIIDFSEAMNTASVNVIQQSGPPVTFTRTWQNANTRLVLSHPPFTGCSTYKLLIEGEDPDGNTLVQNPFDGSKVNPFKFTTVCANPFIVITSPEHGQTNVATNAPIQILFSESMNTGSVTYTFTPSPPGQTVNWGMDTIMGITHGGMQQCTQYTVHVTAGRNLAGNPLVPGPVPNPWSFSTFCDRPYLTVTDPANGATLVPLDKVITIDFNEPMDTGATLVRPTPMFAYTTQWLNGDTRLVVTPTSPLLDCTAYTIDVDSTDKAGNPILKPGPQAPNPFVFNTVCVVAEPYITNTDPAHNQQDVPLNKSIVIDFSEAIDRNSFSISLVPGGITFVRTWSNGDTRVTLTHTQPFPSCTWHTATVAAKDLDGNDLIGGIPGAKPNPWTFRTVCVSLNAPSGLQVQIVGPDLRVVWNSVAGATQYVVYHSLNRLAPWPWSALATTAATNYLHLTAGTDSLPHYYVVRAQDAGGAQSPNSTMGAKVPLTFTYQANRGNVYWISLPYRSMYRTAKDISDALGSGPNPQISVVAKWDPARQTSILWHLFRGQWVGTNFAIAPGDGIWLGIRQTFTWQVNGTDGAQALSFTRYPLPNANIHWFSLPFTSPYTQASDLVLAIEGSLGPSANTKIVEVAKWDGATQSLRVYMHTVSGWQGDNFPIAPGEGVYFRVVNSFVWTPSLITPEVP